MVPVWTRTQTILNWVPEQLALLFGRPANSSPRLHSSLRVLLLLLPQLPVQGSRLCLYEDGTEVTEDYFPGIPNDAELVLLTEGQTWQGCKCKRLGDGREASQRPSPTELSLARNLFGISWSKVLRCKVLSPLAWGSWVVQSVILL